MTDQEKELRIDFNEKLEKIKIDEATVKLEEYCLTVRRFLCGQATDSNVMAEYALLKTCIKDIVEIRDLIEELNGNVTYF